MIHTAEELMQAYERATNRHDLEATLSLIDEDAIYLFSNETVLAGKAAIARAIKRNFDLIEHENYRIANLMWLVQSDEVAACVYDFSWSGTINGKAASGAGRGTTILRRADEGWKVIHEHLSKGQFAA